MQQQRPHEPNVKPENNLFTSWECLPHIEPAAWTFSAEANNRAKTADLGSELNVRMYHLYGGR